jgi:sigma-B regulation protein RsbU (phosphoserine phosphatase)
MVFGQKKNQQLEEEVGRLRRALEELSILNDLARAIATSFETESIVSKVVQRSVKAIGAEQASIHMVSEDEMLPNGTIIFVRKDEDQNDDHFHMTQGLMGAICHHEKRPLLVNDLKNDPRVRGVRLAAGVRNLLCVPLMVGTQMIGVLSAYNKVAGAGFDEDDQRLLAIIAAQSAQVLERARLLEQEKAAERLREDVRLAERIQAGLLPEKAPEVPGYDMAGATEPARHVGGDYFDFIGLADHRWGLTLGDVSGKGLPASLLMANLQATLRGQAFQDSSCHDCVAWCNRLLFRSTPTDKFATLFYSVLDTRSHVLTYCNAGHEQPFLLTGAGEVKRLPTGGLAVGILEEFDYQDDIVHFQPGDILVVFSDGVTDVVNEQDEPFGEERLLEILQQNRDLPAADMIATVRRDLAAHAGKLPPFDDVTMIVVKRDA